MDKFLKTYHGYIFDDWGTECSDDFKSFARKFKNYLTKNLPSTCNIKKHSCNHYDLSGFVEQDGHYIYYSYSWNRYSPVDVRDDGCMRGVLVRFAANDNDWRGEMNHFTSLANLPETIKVMLTGATRKTA